MHALTNTLHSSLFTLHSSLLPPGFVRFNPLPLKSVTDFMDVPATEPGAILKLGVLLGLYLVLRLIKKHAYVYVIVWWGSTILHELTHWLIGFLLGAKPAQMDLVPRRDPQSGALILGSVSFNNLRWWNKLPVATAPLLLLPFGFWLFLKSLPYPLISLNTLLLDLAVLQCVEGFWPSGTDWRHARTSIYALLGIVAFGALFLIWVRSNSLT